jgi:cell filamentation protein
MGNKGNTGGTPSVEDNLLGLTTSEQINESEASGVIEGEKLLLGLDEHVDITTSLILKIHEVTFGHLYTWAGKWRNVSVKVGVFIPPEPQQIPNLMYQFTDELNLIRKELTPF